MFRMWRKLFSEFTPYESSENSHWIETMGFLLGPDKVAYSEGPLVKSWYSLPSMICIFKVITPKRNQGRVVVREVQRQQRISGKLKRNSVGTPEDGKSLK